ncbi:MAG: hypothetical protein ACMXYC_04955, partial [Candidatus Woesearchaeota archaeon]
MPQESYYLFFSDNHCNTTSSTSNPVKTTRLSNIVASVAKEFSCPVIFGGDVYDIGLGAKKITETNPDITVETLEKTLLEDSRGVYKQFNEDFEGVELAGIPGNHDTQAIYDAIPNMHFLNKGAPKTIGGIRFAGAINAYETKMMSIDGKKPLDIIVEDDDISGVDLTQFKEARSQMEQDLKKKFGDKVNPEALAKIIDYNLKIQLGAQSPVYQKLKDEEFDVLVSHKGGLNTGMTISGQGEIDS